MCVSVVPLLPSSISVKCEAEGSRLNRLPGHKDHINSSNEALLSLSFIISVSPLNKLTGVTAALEGLLCPDSPFFVFLSFTVVYFLSSVPFGSSAFSLFLALSVLPLTIITLFLIPSFPPFPSLFSTC